MRRLVNLKLQRETTVAEHTSEFQNLVNQLTSVDLQFDDEMQALLLLSSFLESWETLVVSLSNSAPNGKLTTSMVMDALFNEEARRREMGSTDQSELQALVSEGSRERGRGQGRGHHRGTRKGRSRSQARGRTVRCFYCDQEGHIKRDCPKYKAQVQSSDIAATVVMAVDESEVLLAASDNGKSDCVLDSGSAYHLCRDREVFFTYAACEGRIWMANNTSSRVVGRRSVRFHMADGRSVTLTEVRHVPNLRKNLISIGMLDSKGCSFDTSGGILRVSKENKEMLWGKKTRGLYRLEGNVQTGGATVRHGSSGISEKNGQGKQPLHGGTQSKRRGTWRIRSGTRAQGDALGYSYGGARSEAVRKDNLKTSDYPPCLFIGYQLLHLQVAELLMAGGFDFKWGVGDLNLPSSEVVIVASLASGLLGAYLVPEFSDMVGLGNIPITFLRVLLILACFLFSCLVIGNPSQKYCEPSDLLALKEFAGNLTNGSIISAWSNESICCEWDGVECGNNGGSAAAHRVTVLNLSGRGLRGCLESLVGLNSIRSLNVSSNSFTGDLSDLVGFPNLAVLNLSNNSFTGGLNSQVCSSSKKFQVLDLSMNHLTGGLGGLGNCSTSLQQLHLDGNFALREASGFVIFDFILGAAFHFCQQSFRPDKALSVLQQCTNLTILILTKNFIGEEIPKTVVGFENLMIFALGNCALSGQIPSWLLNLRKLQVLDLSWNGLNGSIPPWIGQIENLFYLDLSNNSLTGEIPKGLTELKSLISARSSSSNLTATSTGIPLYVKRNQSSNSLQYNQASSFPPSIYLSNNKIKGTIWPEIGKLKQLHVLDLSRNNISGTIPSSISDMGNLEVLDLSCNNLYGSIPASFNKLTFLSKFSVANNHLLGKIPTGGQFLSFPNASFEGNPGLCGTIDSPCGVVDNNMGLRPVIPSVSNGKLGQSSIIVITISIAAGIALFLAIILLIMSRREMRNPTGDLDEEVGRPQHRLSEALGSSKLVLFQNSDCKDLTFTDLLKSTSNFNHANIIGCGGFGLVYEANLPDGVKVAVKKLSGDCGQMEREFQAEVEALSSRAQHKNLRVDGGSLLRWDTRLKIAQGAGHGLAYLHKEPNIIHRDIKTSNILLDEKFEAHLADFGLSRLLHPCDTHVTTDLVGTLGYIPPEYSQTLTATFKGDVYSFGVVLLELLTGRRPVEVCKGKNCRDVVSWVFQDEM
ncbi:phytosylfokine-alpha receptor 2 [Actinidia rufa]|uniref:Phytosylfokine-alpha receptor 2 n=1 Tax=Actinidia rufa TaxID=165716 RepID=A0A7J0DG64_9ERIC|nr:phytosylfokine-alpha receptor 2 [Actinidia rufa]